LKIGIALWSLGQAKTFAEFETLLDVAASTGVKAVQPWCLDESRWGVQCALDPDRCATPPQRSNVRKACEKRGLAISALCAQQAGGANTMGGFGEDDSGLDSRIEKTRRALRLATDLGTKIITAHIGPIPQDRDARAYPRFLKSVISVMKEAERCGGYFALETGQESAEVLRQFIEDVGSPNLKVNFDPANMLNYGTVASVKILGEYIVHTHAKDKHPVTGKPTVGEGSVPWKEYLAALKEINYQGWYALEDESGDANVLESVKTGKAFLESFKAG